MQPWRYSHGCHRPRTAGGRLGATPGLSKELEARLRERCEDIAYPPDAPEALAKARAKTQLLRPSSAPCLGLQRRRSSSGRHVAVSRARATSHGRGSERDDAEKATAELTAKVAAICNGDVSPDAPDVLRRAAQQFDLDGFKRHDLEWPLRMRAVVEWARLLADHAEGDHTFVEKAELKDVIDREPNLLDVDPPAALLLAELCEGSLEMPLSAHAIRCRLERNALQPDAPQVYNYMLLDLAEWHRQHGRREKWREVYAAAAAKPEARRDPRLRLRDYAWQFHDDPDVPRDQHYFPNPSAAAGPIQILRPQSRGILEPLRVEKECRASWKNLGEPPPQHIAKELERSGFAAGTLALGRSAALQTYGSFADAMVKSPSPQKAMNTPKRGRHAARVGALAVFQAECKALRRSHQRRFTVRVHEGGTCEVPAISMGRSRSVTSVD